MGGAEYDNIADGYREVSDDRPLVKYVWHPTIAHLVGDLTGAKVLDLACGQGDSSRLFLKLGASEVVGVDISGEQIKLAQSIEAKILEGKQVPGLPIQYHEHDVSQPLPNYGLFDVVSAIMLLNYPKSEEEIHGQASNIAKAMKPNGVFIGLMPNPAMRHNRKAYGVTHSSDNWVPDGCKLTVTLGDLDGNDFCSFTNYRWKKETYDRIFKSHGLTLQFREAPVSDEVK